MNLAYIGAAVGCVTLFGGGYTVAKRAEYVVDGEQVRAIILMEESVERMEFQLEYKLSELRRYESIPADQRSESDLVQIEELKEQISQLRERLKKARGY
jgi:hypothetical protein